MTGTGELWSAYWQIGKETTPGTASAATRKLYVQGTASKDRDQNIIQVSTGTRSNTVDMKLRAVKAGAKFQQPISADEMVELFLSSVQGGVVPAQNGTTGQYNWNFKPGNTLDSQTYEWYDGYRGWRLNGALIDELKLSGSATGDTQADVTIFARDAADSWTMTPALVDRIPNFVQGWNLKLYIDNYGATAGTTNVPATIISWSVDIKNAANRKYFGDNSQATGSVNLSALSVTAEMTLEANPAGFAEFGNWKTATKRLIRLELGNSPDDAVIGTSTIKPTIWLDMPGAWLSADLSGEDQGTRVYKMKYNYVYDVTNAYGFSATLKNARATAYA